MRKKYIDVFSPSEMMHIRGLGVQQIRVCANDNCFKTIYRGQHRGNNKYCDEQCGYEATSRSNKLTANLRKHK